MSTTPCPLTSSSSPFTPPRGSAFTSQVGLLCVYFTSIQDEVLLEVTFPEKLSNLYNYCNTELNSSLCDAKREVVELYQWTVVHHLLVSPGVRRRRVEDQKFIFKTAWVGTTSLGKFHKYWSLVVAELGKPKELGIL